MYIHYMYMYIPNFKFLMCTRAYWRLTKSTRTGIGADTLVTPQDGSSLSLPLVSPLVFLLFDFFFKSKVPSPLSVLCSLSSMFAANKFWRLVMWNACTFPSRFLTRIRVCCPSVSLTRRWRSRIRSSILSLPVFETRSYRCVLWMCGMDVWYGCVSYCVSAWDINWWRTSYALSHTSICHTHPYVTHILRTITHMCVIVRKITHLCVLARILCMCASDIKWSFKSKVIRTRYS